MPYIHLCTNCGEELTCKKNGVNVSLAKNTDPETKAGVSRADFYICKNCGFEILSEFGGSWSAPVPNENLMEYPTYFPKINKWFNKP